MTPEAIDAINRNTEAMTRLAVVWEKLHTRAVAIAADPAREATLNAAGVPLVKPEATPPAGGFVL